MLNHKFYKYDENFQIDSVQEEDFIRISNRLIEDLKSCLSRHVFTEYNLGDKVYGLSKYNTLLDKEDILYLQNCLALKGSTSSEYVKFRSFLEDCLSNGKQVLHEDGSPLTGGLIHDFILCKEVPDDLDPRKYKSISIKIQDQFILDNYDVFKDVDMYCNNLDNLEQGFNYHGITIITPEIAEKILQTGRTFLKGNKSEQAEYFVGDDWEILKQVLETAIADDQFIIHFGI
ncbi:hypothetical protein [Candidatus Enterococcus ferrettii]|uniref:Uncharacterized protein n=1 Tax=Candidatus Enterococcus ferrettii TaxID=2815324 RepID=A0ABV0EL30_9ENTE|nr:hypothetical protein [Enterococcus sp. 665A]MBO1342567.1 hypothetical protein [Enterococcus sp. 665A]